jgi:hypothetical protein
MRIEDREASMRRSAIRKETAQISELIEVCLRSSLRFLVKRRVDAAVLAAPEAEPRLHAVGHPGLKATLLADRPRFELEVRPSRRARRRPLASSVEDA